MYPLKCKPLITVQFGPMQIKLNAADVQPNAAAPPPVKAAAARPTRGLPGSQAARRIDALMGDAPAKRGGGLHLPTYQLNLNVLVCEPFWILFVTSYDPPSTQGTQPIPEKVLKLS
jgi:hypothetical protein